MSVISYKNKYLKYKSKYLNLLKEINGGMQKSGKKQTKSGITSAINGKLGIAKDVREGTAGDGKLCVKDEECPIGSFCKEGNCEIVADTYKKEKDENLEHKMEVLKEILKELS